VAPVSVNWLHARMPTEQMRAGILPALAVSRPYGHLQTRMTQARLKLRPSDPFYGPALLTSGR
jgi:hypothetical protein